MNRAERRAAFERRAERIAHNPRGRIKSGCDWAGVADLFGRAFGKHGLTHWRPLPPGPEGA